MLTHIGKSILVDEIQKRRDKHLSELRAKNVDSVILNSWQKSYEKLLKKHTSSIA